MLFTEWTFLPGLTNFTTEDNQTLTFKISASTKKAHSYHLLCAFNLGALTHLLSLNCFGKSLKYLQKSKQLDWIQSVLILKEEYTRAVQLLYFQNKATFPTNYKRAATPQAVVCKAHHLDSYKHTTQSPKTFVSSTACSVTLSKRSLVKYTLCYHRCPNEKVLTVKHTPLTLGTYILVSTKVKLQFWSAQLKILLSEQCWKFVSTFHKKPKPTQLVK